MHRPLLSSAIAALLAAGCAGSTGGTPLPAPRDRVAATATPTPAAAGTQRAWLRGVGVDAPVGWQRDDLRCGTPMGNTLVVTYSNQGSPACLITRPGTFSVIWLGTFTRPVPDGARLGDATIHTDSDVDGYADTTIDGQPVKETTQHLDDGRTLRLVLFTDRGVFLSAAATDPAVVRAAVQSLQVTDTDPTTGCAVHTHAYDDGTPPKQALDVLLPGEPTSADACVYVDGWLERSAQVTGPGLAELVDAIRAAPPQTSAKAPDDRNCESVADLITPEDNPPMALFFHDAAGSTWTVVAKINPCTRWQSTVSSGNVTRRIDQRLLLALPQLWSSYPDPDSMDVN